MEPDEEREGERERERERKSKEREREKSILKGQDMIAIMITNE